MFILFSGLNFAYQAYAKPFKHEVLNVLCSINEGMLGAIAMIQTIFITDVKIVTVVVWTGWVMVGLMGGMVILNF